MKRLSKCGILVVTFMLIASIAFAQSTIKTGDTKLRGLTDKDYPKLIKLADNVYAYEMIRPPADVRFTTNSLIVITTDGVLVCDGQGSPAATTQMVDEIKKLTNQPIKYVVIGSDHGDHTSGNVSFPQTATFIAHPTSKKNLETAANAPNRAANAPKVVIPTELVTDKKVLKMGNTEIQIVYAGRAHTGGDLMVYLPREKVLFMSEVYFHRIFPSARTAYPAEWIETIKKAEKMDARVFVPGHGFVDDPKSLREELTEYRKALESVVAEAKRLYKPGASADEAFKQANFGPYSSWTNSTSNAPTAFKRAWDELDGKLKMSQ